MHITGSIVPKLEVKVKTGSQGATGSMVSTQEVMAQTGSMVPTPEVLPNTGSIEPKPDVLSNTGSMGQTRTYG